MKNGTLTNKDMVKERKATRISAAGGPEFSDGGEGDCVWQSATAVLAGLGDPSYRVDRFGTVHLSGIVIGGNGGGGDATCNTSEIEDGIVTVLPQSLRPARTLYQFIEGYTLVVVGPTPLEGLPAGAVFWGGPPSFPLALDGMYYIPASSPISPRTSTESRVTPQGRALLRHLLR